MSDLLKEHRPLLREDISDEEFQQDLSQPLRRHMGHRGKARNTIKGAAAIIKNWPDHWSSSVTQWWIGIAMFCLITFVFYNSVIAYSIVATADPIPMPRSVTNNKEIIEQKLTLPKVFMHIIVNNHKEADLNKYMPYIEIIANQYLNYKFNLIIIRNDTIQEEVSNYQAQVNNEDALNFLWTADNINGMNKISSKTKSNINIKYINLSNYLYNSPIRKFWQQLPYHFVEFLVRAVSIWDKGGIAFSPVILTPKSPDAIYIEKLYSLLSSYEELNRQNATNNINHKYHDIKNPKKTSDKHHYSKRVNNIRDIIDALETESSDPKTFPETLSEAENRQNPAKIEVKTLNTKPAIEEVHNNVDNVRLNLTENKVLQDNVDKMSHSNNSIKSVQTDDHLVQNNRSELLDMALPSFFDFLFHEKSKTTSLKDGSTDRITTEQSIKKISTRAISTESTKKSYDGENFLQPMIISAPTNFEKMPTKVDYKGPMKHDNLENLTIDLNGNLLATRNSCHAFLGTVFSNVKHRTEEESVKDFIISELSLFCNGLLSTCKGLDVILL